MGQPVQKVLAVAWAVDVGVVAKQARYHVCLGRSHDGVESSSKMSIQSDAFVAQVHYLINRY